MKTYEDGIKDTIDEFEKEFKDFLCRENCNADLCRTLTDTGRCAWYDYVTTVAENLRLRHGCSILEKLKTDKGTGR